MRACYWAPARPALQQTDVAPQGSLPAALARAAGQPEQAVGPSGRPKRATAAISAPQLPLLLVSPTPHARNLLVLAIPAEGASEPAAVPAANAAAPEPVAEQPVAEQEAAAEEPKAEEPAQVAPEVGAVLPTPC